MNERFVCEHCGAEVSDDFDLEIYHRGCRLAAAFPGAVKRDGGVLRFDMKKVAELLEQKAPEGR